ncbi:hypothetical protein K7I13_15000 [Brucepastera parasyntrophica]|uniref:hypothetical protein n=1 Tax=Brucepastera parasyntrophica TaxID=2880008 RepID=UPI00210EE9D9|nr:hypothetical protein [Brucepastera parasyntrophica]ULQ59739.1 hypothetical protein K7I13_15000 [Brucepastera parasyntrophica]
MLEDISPEALWDTGHRPDKSESVVGEISVSPQGGTMMTEVTEFVLKGKNGFTYPVKRVYDSQTARLDSPSINLSMSIGLNFTAQIGNQIASQLISAGTNMALGPVIQRLKDFFKRNGDYNLAMGIGWRLNLPYVFADNTNVMIRLPTGGYYPIKQMELQGNAPAVSGHRVLNYENHSGDDFTFTVKQVRADFSGMITSVPAIAKLDSGSISVAGAISLIGNVIPDWITYRSELVTKDGMIYTFDVLGRIESISDPAGDNIIRFEYGLDFLLEKLLIPWEMKLFLNMIMADLFP